MKIAVLHDESAYGASLFQHLTARFSDHEVVTWHPGKPPPANNFQILLGVQIGRKVLDSQPQLELVQTTTAGYEGVDVEAASALGIWVSFAPSGETRNAISVATWRSRAPRNMSAPSSTRLRAAGAGPHCLTIGRGHAGRFKIVPLWRNRCD
jgi:hypothetical protein